MPAGAHRAQLVGITPGKQDEVAGSKGEKSPVVDPDFALTPDDDMDAAKARFGERDPEWRAQPERSILRALEAQLPQYGTKHIHPSIVGAS